MEVSWSVPISRHTLSDFIKTMPEIRFDEQNNKKEWCFLCDGILLN